jgi:[ribosomal protein S18]-alanine N-acetyltransferase
MRAIALRCRIRIMQPGDIPQVLDIERASFPTMWPQTVYQRELKNNMARYLVAYEPGAAAQDATSDDPTAGITGLVRRILRNPPAEPTTDRIIGMVGLWFMMGEGHVVTIAVRPECRRMGLGEVLLTLALETALEAQQDEVTLEYRISNDGARAMYDKYGFNQVGVRARYYTDNQEDAVLMTTPPLKSAEFRRLIAQRVAEQRERWGEDYPLADRPLRLTKAAR